MTLQDLIDRYNAKASKPIKSWKQKRSLLEEKVAKLEGDTPLPATPVGEFQPAAEEAAQPEGTVMATRKTKKAKAAKKTAKRAVKKTVAAKTGNGVGTFVRELVAKDKGTKEIYEAAVAKGFETTYKSVASMVCRAKK